MDNSTPDILIQYLDGELSGTEKKMLELQLSRDTTLQKQLDGLRSAKEAIRLYGLKQSISGIHVEMMRQMQHRPVRKLIRYSVAIAASLILLIGGYMIFKTGRPSSEKIFSSNYNTYELATLRDGPATESKVEKAYREKNYTEVLRIHDAGEDRTPVGEFLCGAASLEKKDLPKAIKCFNEVIDASRKTGEPILKDEAEYYLSLSYIRHNDYEEALVLLHAIKEDPAHKYIDKVNDKLIRQVENLRGK